MAMVIKHTEGDGGKLHRLTYEERGIDISICVIEPGEYTFKAGRGGLDIYSIRGDVVLVDTDQKVLVAVEESVASLESGESIRIRCENIVTLRLEEAQV